MYCLVADTFFMPLALVCISLCSRLWILHRQMLNDCDLLYIQALKISQALPWMTEQTLNSLPRNMAWLSDANLPIKMPSLQVLDPPPACVDTETLGVSTCATQQAQTAVEDTGKRIKRTLPSAMSDVVDVVDRGVELKDCSQIKHSKKRSKLTSIDGVFDMLCGHKKKKKTKVKKKTPTR